MKQEKKEKTFIATDENKGIIGVVSALAPEKAAAKIFQQKFKEKWETTKKDPIETVSYTHLDVYKRQTYGSVFSQTSNS